jgi:hypothetical protein
MARDMNDMIEKWCDENRAHHFEGDTGLENFNRLCVAMGYRENQFKFGSPMEVFLSDNPGVFEVIIEWISDHAGPELKTALGAEIGPEDDDDEDDEG